MLPTIGCNTSLMFIGFMNAAFGLRFTFAFGLAAAFALGFVAVFAFDLDFVFDLALAGAFFSLFSCHV